MAFAPTQFDPATYNHGSRWRSAEKYLTILPKELQAPILEAVRGLSFPALEAAAVLLMDARDGLLTKDRRLYAEQTGEAPPETPQRATTGRRAGTVWMHHPDTKDRQRVSPAEAEALKGQGYLPGIGEKAPRNSKRAEPANLPVSDKFWMVNRQTQHACRVTPKDESAFLAKGYVRGRT